MPTVVFLFWLFVLGFVQSVSPSESPVAAYRRTVGPPVTVVPLTHVRSPGPAGRLIVVNWNVHVGHGDVVGLINNISTTEAAGGFGKPEFVLLLEESFRQSPEIPAVAGGTAPRRIPPPEPRTDIEDLARRLGWWLYYAPSMRNGHGEGDDAEDRGNAILSTLPLEAAESVELPFAVQRRVAVIATVVNVERQPIMRVAVTHLDTRAPLMQGWIFGGPAARTRQAKGFVDAVKKFEADRLPMIVAGDFNTYLGSSGVIDTVSRLAPRTNCGNQPTHTWGMTLDHIFANIPEDWAARCVRPDSTFGSDHYPLVLTLNIPWERWQPDSL
jgi:endonuclease/exonuclease/phosphatase family metal-dependent hydrolase